MKIFKVEISYPYCNCQIIKKQSKKKIRLFYQKKKRRKLDYYTFFCFIVTASFLAVVFIASIQSINRRRRYNWLLIPKEGLARKIDCAAITKNIRLCLNICLRCHCCCHGVRPSVLIFVY